VEKPCLFKRVGGSSYIEKKCMRSADTPYYVIFRHWIALVVFTKCPRKQLPMDKSATAHIATWLRRSCWFCSYSCRPGQEIPARDIHPIELIMLLRVRFGIGSYDISVRPLSKQFHEDIPDFTYRGYLPFIRFGHQESKTPFRRGDSGLWMPLELELFPV
jgi:hypothetical protein